MSGRITLPEVGQHSIRQISLPLEVRADVDRRIITAYASIFDVLDAHGTIFRRGAWEESIKGNDRVRMLYQHQRDRPIGTPTHMAEDSRGLLTVTKIAKVPDGDLALRMADEGVLDSLSVGFEFIAFKEFEDEDLRKQLTGWARHWPMVEITKAGLTEYSLVTFASNPDARIIAIRSIGGWLPIMERASVIPSKVPDVRVIEPGTFVSWQREDGSSGQGIVLLTTGDGDERSADVQVYDGETPTDEITTILITDLSETDQPVPEPERSESETVVVNNQVNMGTAVLSASCPHCEKSISIVAVAHGESASATQDEDSFEDIAESIRKLSTFAQRGKS